MQLITNPNPITADEGTQVGVAAELKELADALNAVDGIEVTLCDASESPFWLIAYLETGTTRQGTAISSRLAVWDANWSIDLSIINGRSWYGDPGTRVVQVRGEGPMLRWLLEEFREDGLLPGATGGAA